MKKCPNCNKELNDNAKFCDECGTKIETDVQPEVVESINQEPAADAETNENPKKKGHKIATIVAVIVVLAVIAAIGTTVVFKVLPTINQNKLVKQDHFFYFKDNNIFYVDLEQELTEPVQVSSKLIDEELEPSDTANSTAMLRDKAYLSSDGKYIFYPEHLRKNEDLFRISNEYVEGDTFDLYYKCIKGTKDEVSKEPEKIASDVIGYKVNTDTTCVTYLKSTDGELYQYDFIESNKLASDVKDFYLNADTQRLVYTTNDGGIYEKELETETSKIDSDVSEISYLSADLSIIYYLKEDVLYKK